MPIIFFVESLEQAEKLLTMEINSPVISALIE